MADPQHAALAKKGSHAIARWREQRYLVRRQLDLSGAFLSRARLVGADLCRDNLSNIDLTDADLYLADLSGANLRSAHLWRSNLRHANLRDANLAGASLGRCDLRGSCLQGADLRAADLSSADLSRADLGGANLSGANLTETTLSWANLAGASLRHARLTATILDLADLTGADLRGAAVVRGLLQGAIFTDAIMEMTLLGDCDLSQAIGLESVRHTGPSIIGVDSLGRSRGLVPDVFLRRAGVGESLIAALEQLRGCQRSYPRVLVVSSGKDAEFVGRVLSDLRGSGVLCWSWTIDDEAAFESDGAAFKRAAFYDRLALVCSSHSLENPHACRFFADAVRHNRSLSGQSLLPLAVDNQLFERQDQLASALRQLQTVDFRGWEGQEIYQPRVAVLIAALS